MKIIFKDAFIDKISGPISLYILVPIGHEGSVIILLGDDHMDSRFQCTSCTCDKSLDSCCHKIYNDDIFKYIDNTIIGTSKTVGFFIESMNVKLDPSKFENIVKNPEAFRKTLEMDRDLFRDEKYNCITKFKYNFKACLWNDIKRLNGIYENICVAPNISWHYADPRSIDYTNPNEVLIYESLIVNCWKLFDFIFMNALDLQESNLPKHDYFIEYCEHISLLYDLTNFDKYIDVYSNEKDSLVNKYSEKCRKNFSQICVGMIPLLFQRINRDPRVKTIDETKVEDFLQFKSNITEKFLTISIFFKSYAEYLRSNISFETLKESINSFIKIFGMENLIDSLSKKNMYQSSEVVTAHFLRFYDKITLNHVHTMHTSFFLDLYFLSRYDKYDISMIYCGEEHCMSLIDIFTKRMKYKVHTSCEPTIINGEISRCVDLASLNGPYDMDFKF